jgi:hypothetical protein
VLLTGENLEHWTWEERRDFLNWCLDEQVLTIQDGRLVPVEETIPTVPLTAYREGDTPGSTEDVEVIHDGERDYGVITTEPTTSPNEVPEEAGSLRRSDRQAVKETVNVQKSTEEGLGDAL